MHRVSLLALVPLVLLLAGCIGLPDGEPATSDGLADPQSAIPAGMSDCDDARKNLTHQITDRLNNPFEERPTTEPALVDCGDQGAFYLAAFGLEGQDIVSLSWTFTEDTECSYAQVVSGEVETHGYYVAYSVTPEGSSIGGGTVHAGEALHLFAGPWDSNEFLSDGDSAVGGWVDGHDNLSQPAGELTLSIAATHWAPRESAVSQGSSLLFLMVCDAAFNFNGIRSADQLAMFSHRDMQDGAGAHAGLRAGTSAGAALEMELPAGGTFAGRATTRAGGGALQRTDANETRTDRLPVYVVEPIAPGGFGVDLAGGGEYYSALGVAHGPLETIRAEAIIGDT